MSALAATQIPKPSDEQAFERASITLWQGLLKDPNVQRNGRRGQRQNGVDLFGVRNGDPAHHVGIQCKLKGDGHFLTETELRDEVRKALTFKPELREYFITATSPDDVALQEVARELAVDLKAKGRNLLIYVWGWNTLEERISSDAAARKQFDPDYGPFSEQILEQVGQVAIGQEEIKDDIHAGFASISAQLARFETQQVSPGDDTININLLDAQLDAEINEYRDLAIGGKPRVAQPLLERLLNRVQSTASGRILFRIKANIGICMLGLREDDRAAAMLSEAYEHAPTEPKAIANKAFSLLLQGKWKELLDFGAISFQDDPTNEGLAGYIVQAARFDTSITDPLLLLPEELRTSASVMIGHVDFLRHRQPPTEWWNAAAITVATYPEEPQAIQFSAEANLEKILSSESFQRTRLLSPEKRALLESSANTLLTLWDKVRTSDGVLRPEAAALCSNTMVAFHALDNAPKALEVANQGVALAPNDTDIIARAGLIALDNNDNVLAEQMLTKLPPSREAAVLGFRLYTSNSNWTELAKLLDLQAEHIPESERAVITAAGRLASIKLTPSNDTEARIKAVAEDFKKSARANIFVSRFAQNEGFTEVAEATYQAALLCIDENSHIAARITAAIYAAWRDDWRIVADLLDGHLSEDHDSDELRTLARAFANDNPIRERALRFFDRLPETIRNLPFFLYTQGIVNLNRGDLPAAETALRKAAEEQPNLQHYLALFSVLHRSERSEEIKPLLAAIDLSVVEGTPKQKMQLAKIIKNSDNGHEAISFAYQVLQSARNDPDVALGYFGLVILSSNDNLIPTAEVVSIDTWVRLEDKTGESLSFIVAQESDRTSDQIFNQTHPIVVRALGLKVGDHFTITSLLGHDREWRVMEIKHKYLHALHDVMNNFETRFPDAQGFYRFTTIDGDIQPILDQIRRISENDRRFADLYLVHHLPLNMSATHVRGDTIGFAEYIRSLDFSIETCSGTEPERLAAHATLTNHRAAGAVLDSYTAWTVATMDAFDILKKAFGTLIIAQSVIDELRSLLDKYAFDQEESMTLTWRNGEYIRETYTAEEIISKRNYISSLIVKVENACTVKPATAPDGYAEEATRFTDLFDAHVLDAAYLAAEEGVLVSEDLYYRQIAESVIPLQSVWLQAVFAFAHDTGLINDAEYVDIVIKLAARRHSYVSFNAKILYDVFKLDDTKDLAIFRTVIAYLGGKNAEMQSHLNAVKTLLDWMWSNNPDLKTMKATGMLLEQMIKHRGPAWATTLAWIKLRTTSQEFRNYASDWIAGHFLSAQEVAVATHRITQEIKRRLER